MRRERTQRRRAGCYTCGLVCLRTIDNYYVYEIHKDSSFSDKLHAHDCAGITGGGKATQANAAEEHEQPNPVSLTDSMIIERSAWSFKPVGG